MEEKKVSPSVVTDQLEQGLKTARKWYAIIEKTILAEFANQNESGGSHDPAALVAATSAIQRYSLNHLIEVLRTTGQSQQTAQGTINAASAMSDVLITDAMKKDAEQAPRIIIPNKQIGVVK